MLEFGRTGGTAGATPRVGGALSQGRMDATGVKSDVSGAVRHSFNFRELLSELNPLQYIPVIGILFRAITGEVIPEPVRDAGALVFSTLIGGPVGAALDLGELAAEKLSGIDPEKIGDKLLADIGIGHKTAISAPTVQVAQTAPPAGKVAASAAWSPTQLAAYGVTTTAGGTLEQGRLAGSDVLNGLELEQIRARQALAQYNSVKPA